jgi:hypothetical protein
MLSGRASRLDAAVVVALFVAAFGTAFLAIKAFRSEGVQPWFYQGNFEPAVMMACGRGFISATPQAVPPELGDFLQRRRNDFDCSLFAASLPQTPITWNATWYYLYGTTAAVWRITGISWTALDGLVAGFAAVAAVALYGLFRLVAVWWVAAGVALLLTASPANLTQILSLRDYSKAPFVLLAVWILAMLVTRPLRRGGTLLVASIYGALVGFGYGFRGDLAVMVPFGILVVLVLLPGPLKRNLVRNGLAALLLLAAFVVTAWPVLQGLSKGGCQFHYALLGLTTTLTNGLDVTPSLYRFGDHFLDTFVDLKVGDYAHRVLNMPVPILCSPEYDTASGQIFTQMAKTFPADLVVHAYGSVLMVLRAGLSIPAVMQPAAPFSSMPVPTFIYATLHRFTDAVAPAGVFLPLAAIGLAWARSVRLGIALTLFVLFLAGYPAIEFETRHWFHLRFIPWWAGLMVVGEMASRARRCCGPLPARSVCWCCSPSHSPRSGSYRVAPPQRCSRVTKQHTPSRCRSRGMARRFTCTGDPRTMHHHRAIGAPIFSSQRSIPPRAKAPGRSPSESTMTPMSRVTTSRR